MLILILLFKLGMVPFLKEVLSTILSNMKAAKKENLRYAYATALSRFSEAILDYEANIQDAPDQSVHKLQFKEEFDSAHEVLFSRYFRVKYRIAWLQIQFNYKLFLNYLKLLRSII